MDFNTLDPVVSVIMTSYFYFLLFSTLLQTVKKLLRIIAGTRDGTIWNAPHPLIEISKFDFQEVCYVFDFMVVLVQQEFTKK